MDVYFTTRDQVIEPPFTVTVGESHGRPNWRTEGPFAAVEEASRIAEAHKTAGRLADLRDAAGRPVDRRVRGGRH